MTKRNGYLIQNLVLIVVVLDTCFWIDHSKFGMIVAILCAIVMIIIMFTEDQ